MTRQEYIDLFGQDPVDQFGEDWEEMLSWFKEEADENVECSN